jgi:hypothetical protein
MEELGNEILRFGHEQTSLRVDVTSLQPSIETGAGRRLYSKRRD